MTTPIDAAFLRTLHRSGRSEQVVLAVLAVQPAEVYEITVDGLLEQAKKAETELARRNATRVLRALDKNGLGRLIPGRWDSKSRFVGDVPLSMIGRFAIGESVVGVEPGNSTAGPRSENESESVETHRIVIRPGSTIELPGDLSRAEAERLIKLIENLPND